MKKVIVLTCVLTGIFTSLAAQQSKHTYKESDELFANPEKGFYIPSGTKAGKFIPLDLKQLQEFRTEEQKLKGANYSFHVTLLYRAYELDIFKHQALSPDFLSGFQNDLDIVRKAGLKVILRFAYTNTANNGDCKDEYKICPPYGDAPREIVMKHVSQLKPLLQKNADVIAVLQQGFIGIWGENYFTDYFGCATDDGQGVIPDSSWVHRNLFLKALLDAMPKDRVVQVRTPQLKQRYVYGSRALTSSKALTQSQAFNGSDMARIGFHNDCFLASPDDYGTFYDYGNSVSKRDTANKSMRKYFEEDSRYVAVGGETCDDAYSPQNDCAPFGIAEQEMASMHYSYLNAAYNNQVNNDWDSLGCMKSIRQKLGYRIILNEAWLPSKIKKGSSFNIELKLQNTGYAAPFNPRPVQLLLRHITTGKVYTLNIKTSVRSWFTGNILLKQQFKLPANMIPGKYEMLLNLPDGYTSLQGNPLYSVRLANEDVWEAATGYNKLNHFVEIR